MPMDLKEQFFLNNVEVRDELLFQLIRKDLDANEHERLSNITLKTQIIVK